MSDLISRQAAIDVVKRLMGDYELSRTVQTGLYILPSAQPEPCEDAVSREQAVEVADAVWTVTGDKNVAKVWQQIKDLPPVILKPEIIRCKDCVYYHPTYCEVWSKYGTVQTRENGYCYMAERREEGEQE